MTFKPMLAGKAPADLSTLKFPVLVSPKLDGIRCVIRGGVAYSRNLKPIPNKYIQTRLANCPHDFDGELIVGDEVGNDVWNRTQSGVMREDGEPDFTFCVFDDFSEPDLPYEGRYEKLARRINSENAPGRVALLYHERIMNPEELQECEEWAVSVGFEGIMVRSLDGKYKFGRATTKEGSLLKVKRFEDHEATVIGVVEKMTNNNEATKDELGRTKRSHKKEGKVGAGTMGALKCSFRHPNGTYWVDFEIGTGFDDAQRAEWWAKRDTMGRPFVTYKCQGFGESGVPRFPVFKGVRNAIDLPATEAA